MVKKITYILFFITSLSFSQAITVDDASYDPADLVDLLLSDSCTDATNISASSSQAVAYFNQNGSTFPLTEGIIIRTGEANLTAGQYTGNDLSSELNINGDADLEAISVSTGQNPDISDTAFLQFDFIPISDDFNFNFVFASNEYGQYQCGFSDVFAFLLTDLNTSTTTNLAVIPATTTPVTVTTIRDNAYNSGCTSENPSLFSTYNVNNPGASTLNMRGHTTVLNASSTLIPDGRTYRIRLVIGDYGNNTDFDSAVFIDTGNFITSLDLGEDTSLCTGDSISVTTELDATDFTHVWTQDGNTLAETSNTLTITEAGVYEVTATKNGCDITDTITITDLAIVTPNNIPACDDGSGAFIYDLSVNDETVLGIDDAIYDVYYFANQTDIPNTPITGGDITSYNSPGNETIYVKIYNTLTDSFCDLELTFDLTISQAAEATEPDDIQLCNTADPVTTNLTDQNAQILGALNPFGFTITYFATQTDAQNNQNPLDPNYSISIGNSPQTVWALLVSNNNPDCFDIVSFDVIVNPLPTVSSIDDVVECSQYTLPNITDGNYYTGPGGTGTMLNEGDIIDVGGTYYIYIGPDANGCFNESSFILTLIDEYTIPLFYCGEFSIPTPPEGAFYTAPDGPNGTGTLIPVGTTFTSADLPLTVHFYAEVDGIECRNEPFNITIYDLPPVDTLTDVVTCVSYTLEPITNGDYYSETGGTGTAYNAGDDITTSGTYYIYNTEVHNANTPDEITCDNESFFEIDIINNPGNRTECGSYILPNLEVGGYFSAPGGTGTNYPFGFEVTTTTNIYIYAETSTAPNCTSNLMFTVTIVPIPPVDELEDVISCEDDPYIIQATPNGNGDYYADDGAGSIDLTAPITIGTQITTLGLNTIHVYNLVNGCSSQSSFTVEIVALPLIDSFTDVFSCDPYILPDLTDGTYFTLPGGTNDPDLPVLQGGSIIETTQTIYIYNEASNLASCNTETVFTVNIDGVGTFDDVTACDNYTLPPLDIGAYYSASGADLADAITNFDYTFDPDPLATNTYTIFVANGDRSICEAEFTLTISQTPVLSTITNEVVCGNYQLPALDQSNFTANYYTEPNGVGLITNTNLTTIGEQTIYVYATAFNNTDCFDETSFTVTIHPLLDLVIEDGIICVDVATGETLQGVLLESNLNPSEFTVDWYLNGNLVFTGPDYFAEEAGTYIVETTMLGIETPPDCNYVPTEVNVTESSAATATYTITEDFVDNATITVNITGGFGQYLYQLDDGLFQESNQFHNVSSGDHIITIIDTLANCDTFTLEVTVLKYPKFFTPNGDNVNETWNIRDLADQPEAIITIFDRFGKLITQIAPAGNGWDGTYNGNSLFASDYWFIVSYRGRNGEDKEFKAHFSLKR